MRFPIAIVAAAALAPVLFLTACSGVNGASSNNSLPASSTNHAASVNHDGAKTQPQPTDAPLASTPVSPAQSAPIAAPKVTPTPAKTAAPVTHPITADPRPASPPSTGLIPVTTWKGVPAAKTVFVGSQRIVAFRADGSILGNWVLPGNLPGLVAGLTTAFGHSPLATVNGSFGWKYTWDGFVIYDDTPEVVGVTDPAYQWDVTVKYVDGVLVKTVNNISVGTPYTTAHAVADVSWAPAPWYVSELSPYALTVPAGRSARLWSEVIAGTTPTSAITEMRGPVASWIS